MPRAIREYGRFVAAIVVFGVISAVSGAYIVTQQRLRTPLEDRYEIAVELPTSQSLTSGQNQAVNVAGVRVGDVVRTRLREGRALVTLSIERGKLPHVYRDARAHLHPNTPLKDMQIELYPGRPPAPRMGSGDVLPVAQSTAPVDSDELLAALDTDTRAYFRVLISASERGLRGRGRDLRLALRALGPTTEQLRRVGDAMAVRRGQLARLVHNLAVLSRATAARDRELGTVVEAGAATLRALAGQDAALRQSVALLPSTLASARSSLVHATALANETGPTLNALMPTARRLPAALRAAGPLVARTEPFLRTQVRPLVREAAPVVADLGPAIANLQVLSPHLKTAFSVFDYVANELAYNPAGDDEGYLFWLAWFAHNANSALSTEDAHGPAIRGLALVSCSSLASQPSLGPVLQAFTGVVPACP
ncbi:MAG: phospholipid/cholesterol/gamma-HCH transport system substrate-binding protein [Solirubrobacteraceae bacterium]|jgi:phospholipid/cholesterol/gamma-HCH transport system substrate-binding protein|nr:phospholipid/cholesterol/gamma-HCH transport system substrate-binding protein [Solirubrobacteraceae bacterium]